MTPVKSVLLAISTGAIAYALASYGGDVFHSSDENATIGDKVVTSVLSPSATKLSPSAKSSVTKLSPSAIAVTATVIPALPVVPRISSALSPSPVALPSVIIPRLQTPTPLPPTPSLAIVSPTPTATPEASVTVLPSDTPVLTPEVSSPAHIVINEVAWAGTAAHAVDEWIELYNAGSAPVDLTGWSLQTDSGSGPVKLISLGKVITPDGYFLIERTDDTTVSSISADIVGSFGGSGLSNSYERLWLQNADGILVDEVAQCLDGKGVARWCGGSASPGYFSMERSAASLPGTEASNWSSNIELLTTGNDALGAPLRGTPKFKNSITH